MEQYYLVEFKVYQYDGGSFGNEPVTHSIRRDTMPEAKKIQEIINRAFLFGNQETVQDSEWLQNYLVDHTPCGGHVKSFASIYIITKELYK